MKLQKEAWLNSCDGRGYKEILNRAYDAIMANVSDEYSPWAPYRAIRPGPKENFGGIWNWDTAFHAMCVSRWDTELAKECILAFLQYELEDGKYPDVIRDDGSMSVISSKPPVMAKYALLVYRRCQDRAFLEKTYESLKRNVGFWERARQSEGLFFYGAETEDEKEWDLYARWESGWDDSVRWDAGIEKLYPIDLQCFMVECYRALGEAADILGQDGTAFLEKAETLSTLVREYFFDRENGIFTDIFKKDKTHSRVYSPASFMPLYIGIASDDEAGACAAVAEKKFCPAMPTVAYDDPAYVGDYWRGHTWLNVAYFAIKGLKNYGFSELAYTMRETLLSFADKNKDAIYEKYDADTGEGKGCRRFSWSSAFLIEFILNF